MKVLDVGPGKIVREAKDYLTNEVVEGRLAPDDVDNATKLVRQLFTRIEAG
jgi:hypothetical protein